MDPTTPPDRGGPDWVRETIAVTVDELRRFATTAIAFTVRPRRFGAAWVAGTTRALNPVGMMATALAVTSALVLVLGHDDAPGIAAHVAVATMPYLYYVLIGALAHPLLRLGGSPRPLRTSVAVTLFAGAGPGLLFIGVVIAVVGLRVALFGPIPAHAAFWHGVPDPYVYAVQSILLAAYALFLLALAFGLAGAHGVTRRRAILSVALAVIAAGLVVGTLRLDLPLPYLVVDPHQWPPVIDLRA